MSQERDERMWTLAYKLAQSGEYSGWWDIEMELRAQGFSRANRLLDDEKFRERLDSICTKARKGSRLLVGKGS